jgi:hypothetical protein
MGGIPSNYTVDVNLDLVTPVELAGLPTSYSVDIGSLPKIQIGLDPINQPHYTEPAGYCSACDGGSVDSSACAGEFHPRILPAGPATGVHPTVRRGAGNHGTLCSQSLRAMRRHS